MNKRSLRVSGHKDYVAVDIINEDGGIERTPFYLKPGEATNVKYYDQDDEKWYKTRVKISEDFSCLDCMSPHDEFEWESPFDELKDDNAIRFFKYDTN